MKFGLWGSFGIPNQYIFFDLEFRPESSRLGSLPYHRWIFPYPPPWFAVLANLKSHISGTAWHLGLPISRSSPRSINRDQIRIWQIWMNPIHFTTGNFLSHRSMSHWKISWHDITAFNSTAYEFFFAACRHRRSWEKEMKKRSPIINPDTIRSNP
jgi:hypothetical protein